jgi:hypothetical protein
MANMSLTTASNLFKNKYLKLSENTYNSFNVLLGRVKKDYNFVGKRMDVAVPTSFIGGVGSGSLPTPNIQDVQDAQITAKKVYAVVEIDREAIKASSKDEGAFVQMTKHVVKQGVESYMRNCSRILFGDGTGALGSGDGATNVTGAGTTGSPYLVKIGTATWKEANWEERDFINYDTETTQLEIVAVAPTTRVLSLVGTSAGLAALVAGPGPVPTNKSFYMQNSKNNDPMGLKGALDATSSTLYAVTVGRRWQAFQKAASSAGISADLMNECMLGVEKQCGKVPKLIVTSYTQYRKVLNMLEDQKQYTLDPRSTDLKGKISFKGVEFMSSQGPIGIFPERFCEDDRMYFLNDDYITLYHRPDFGWFDDDGTVFLRTTGDAYGARYGGYWEAYIPPSFHGVMTGLAT